MKFFYTIILFSALVFVTCRENNTTSTPSKESEEIDTMEVQVNASSPTRETIPDPVQKESKGASLLDTSSIKKTSQETAKKTSSMVDDFTQIDPQSGIVIDIKYATKDNFTKKQIYPCGKCYLRPSAATAIIKADKILQKKYGYRLKMFDCYRPRPAQQRLWDVVPNADYVTPPAKGSMHNRGLAVDLTVVDGNGKDLDMGTPYDFFGKEAHTDNLQLPQRVLKNRQILSSVMKEVGFVSIRTEWWHFSLDQKAALSDWEWPCQ